MESNNHHSTEEDLSSNELSDSDTKPTKQLAQARQLFIGNLPFRVRWQDIKDLFRKAGQVVRADVALNHENRSKGHGTILFTNIEEAQQAMDMFNGYKWQGRILEVREDRGFRETEEKEENEKLVSPSTSKVLSPAVASEITSQKPKIKDPEIKEKMQEDDDCKQLFIGNLPFHCRWQDLRDLFRNSGKILRADVVLNFEGRSRGFGTVLFSSHEDAKSAIEQYNGFEFHNRILRVHFDKFAATHQRIREQEAESFGQRQIHDPESVELLRQTYLSSPLQISSYGMSSLIPPQIHHAPQSNNHGYYGNTMAPQQQTYNTQQLPFGNRDIYNTYQNSSMYPSHLPSTFGYQSTYAPNTLLNNQPAFDYHVQQPWAYSPSHYPADINSLSHSLHHLHFDPTATTTSITSSSHTNTNINSAGLEHEEEKKPAWY